MLWGSADGKDVHLITLKTEKLEAAANEESPCDLMKLPTSICLHKSETKTRRVKIIHQHPPVSIHDPAFELSTKTGWYM